MAKTPITLPTESEADPADIADLDRQGRDRIMVGWFEDVFCILNAYQSHQIGSRQLRMSLLTMQLALGFHLAAGADGPSELARKCNVSKQTLTKCLNHFISQLRLTPLPGQRSDAARKNMAEARLLQLTK